MNHKQHREQLANKGFCVISLCTSKEAAEWKREVKVIEQQHKGPKVDPSTQSVLDAKVTGINVWMAEDGDISPYFLKKLAHHKLRIAVNAFYPCLDHVNPDSEDCVGEWNRSKLGLQHDRITSKHGSEELGLSVKIPTFPIELLSCKPVIKSKNVSHPSPWHQDYVYWLGTPKVSAWIALDDADRSNGCLKVIPGSHKWGLIPHEKFQERIGFDHRVPESTINSLCRKFGTPIDVPLKAGEAIIFSDLLLHCSNPNTTGKDRFSLIPTFRSSSRCDPSSVWRCSATYCENSGAFVTPINTIVSGTIRARL